MGCLPSINWCRNSEPSTVCYHFHHIFHRSFPGFFSPTIPTFFPCSIIAIVVSILFPSFPFLMGCSLIKHPFWSILGYLHFRKPPTLYHFHHFPSPSSPVTVWIPCPTRWAATILSPFLRLTGQMASCSATSSAKDRSRRRGWSAIWMTTYIVWIHILYILHALYRELIMYVCIYIYT